jgi:hypothetical protein
MRLEYRRLDIRTEHGLKSLARLHVLGWEMIASGSMSVTMCKQFKIL